MMWSSDDSGKAAATSAADGLVWSAWVVVYCISAALLTLVNQLAFSTFPDACFVIIVQNAIAVAVLWLASKHTLGALSHVSSAVTWRWAPLSCLYVLARLLELRVLTAMNAASSLVMSSLIMVFVAAGECCMGAWLNWLSVVSLCGMIFGAIVHGGSELGLGFTGRACVTAYLAISVIYLVYLRVLAQSDRALSAAGMAYTNGILSVPVLAICALVQLEARQLIEEMSPLFVGNTEVVSAAANPEFTREQMPAPTTSRTIGLLLASGLLASALSTSTFYLNKCTSATSTMLIHNSNKLAVALTRELLQTKALALKSLAGAALAVASVYIYSKQSCSIRDGEEHMPKRDWGPSSTWAQGNKLAAAFSNKTHRSPHARSLFMACLAFTLTFAVFFFFFTSPSTNIESKPVAMRLVVITGGTRVDSLYRLLDSLCKLENDGDRLDMDVWIDVPEEVGGVRDEILIKGKLVMATDIEQLGRNGTYRHGHVRAHIWDQHMGLRGQWLDAWHASIPGGLTEHTEEIGLILEDDMQLSPFAWRWLKAAYAAYGSDPRVAGFTVQRASLCLARCPNINGGPDGAGGGFYYGLIGTWGYSPTAKSFARFRRWYYSLPDNYKPYVEGIWPTEWYKSMEKAGTEKTRMWEMHHIKYTDTHEDKYTVYVKCKNGKTLGVNHRETGLNFDGKDPSKKGPMHEMLTEWDPDLVEFAKDPFILNYSAVVVGGIGLDAKARLV